MNSDQIFSIVNVPYFLIVILTFWSFFQKKKFLFPALLAFSFSATPLFFNLIEENIMNGGTFEIGLKVGMYASIVGTVPLAIFGWYLGFKLQNAVASLVVVLALFVNFLVVKSYQYVVQKNEKILKKEVIFDCQKLPYHCAIKENQFGKIDSLKKEGFDIEARDSLSRTPLWYGLGKPEAVKKLLENGAAADAFNIYGETPLAHSLVISLKPNLEVAKLLVLHGAQINRQVGFRKPISILNFAIVSENYSAVNFALENGADPAVSDGYRRTSCQRLIKLPSGIIKDLKKYCP